MPRMKLKKQLPQLLQEMMRWYYHATLSAKI